MRAIRLSKVRVLSAIAILFVVASFLLFFLPRPTSERVSRQLIWKGWAGGLMVGRTAVYHDSSGMEVAVRSAFKVGPLEWVRWESNANFLITNSPGKRIPGSNASARPEK